MDSNPISVPNLCEWCGGVGTCRCGLCHDIYYCSREHQMLHWDIHKTACKKTPSPVMSSSNMSHNMPLSNLIHNLPTSNISHLSSSNVSHMISPNINPNISLPNIRSNMPLSNIRHNMPAPSISINVPLSNISHNIPSSNISHNVPSSNISHNVPSSNISHNVPSSSNISHNVLSSNISHNVPSSNMNQNICMPSTSNMAFASSTSWNQSNVSTHINEDLSHLPSSSNTFIPNNSCIPSEKSLDYNVCTNEMISSLSSDLISSDNSFWNLIDSCNAQNVSEFDLYLDKDTLDQTLMSALQNLSSASNISNANSPSVINDDDVNLIECAPLSDICRNVINDLNMYGICVLDKFIGSKRGNLVLDDVKSLYNSGIFEKGKLVKTSAYIASESIRSDVTTWVDGTEPHCPNIGYLMQKLDLVIATCNKMPNNGQLSKYKLHRRTKAMVACYPGNGTHYKKHVDNPNKDGRCITCIYYLNQNWDVKKHGGILRMFPSARDSDVAQIAPIFDRMLFFWSDRRNPHEVLPAHAMRFAITVWYFDADEREASLKAQEKSQLSQSSSFS